MPGEPRRKTWSDRWQIGVGHIHCADCPHVAATMGDAAAHAAFAHPRTIVGRWARATVVADA